jgi:hypothetical protein
MQAPRVLAGRGLDVVLSDEEWGRQALAGMHPNAVTALKRLPSDFGSAIGPEHVDGGCWQGHCCGCYRLLQDCPRLGFMRVRHYSSNAAAFPASLHGFFVKLFTLLLCAEELAALGGGGLAQLVADAVAGKKPRLYLLDYWLMDTFWAEAPPDAAGRTEHAGRALFFLQQ